MQRFPGAAITGIDNSPAMLEAARKACPEAVFAAGDIAHWMPEDKPDLIFSNAAFHWVPDHLGALERLARCLPDGGVLAVQMPDNLMEPSHALMRQAAEQGPWAEKLAGAASAREALLEPARYHARLKPFFRRLDIWHTIYNHPLDGVDGIVSWLTTSGLRPWLDPLDAAGRQGFLAQYREMLARAYPPLPDGTVLLRFPRLFVLGVR